VTRPARIALILAATLISGLALAPAAMAGEGLWGPIDDKVITFFSFAVMAFFVTLVTVLSLIQIRLENRKQRAREELERLRRP
jgi:hypothetical protein